jgi:hypothetical protein
MGTEREMAGALLVVRRIVPLPAETKRALDVALMPLGVEAIGARGKELVLKVIDLDRAPKDFESRVREALSSPGAVEHWSGFESAAYN